MSTDRASSPKDFILVVFVLFLAIHESFPDSHLPCELEEDRDRDINESSNSLVFSLDPCPSVKSVVASFWFRRRRARKSVGSANRRTVSRYRVGRLTWYFFSLRSSVERSMPRIWAARDLFQFVHSRITKICSCSKISSEICRNRDGPGFCSVGSEGVFRVDN